MPNKVLHLNSAFMDEPYADIVTELKKTVEHEGFLTPEPTAEINFERGDSTINQQRIRSVSLRGIIGSSWFNTVEFTSCVFTTSFMRCSHVFHQCRFNDCTFVVSVSPSFRGIFDDCIFYNCTFIACTNDEGHSGKDLLFKDCTFYQAEGDFVTEHGFSHYFDPEILPREGEFIAWKKVHFSEDGEPDLGLTFAVLELKIPASAYRVYGINSDTPKIRVSAAIVVNAYETVKVWDETGWGYTREIVPFEPERLKKIKFYSTHTANFEYEIGKMIIPDFFDHDIRQTCTNGIHCFVDKNEAILYN